MGNTGSCPCSQALNDNLLHHRPMQDDVCYMGRREGGNEGGGGLKHFQVGGEREELAASVI